MRLLPSEQKEMIEKIPTIISKTMEYGRMTLYEPCNCGSQIRHNNGGNYHEIIYVAYDEDQWFISEDSTSEFEERGEWRKITIEELTGILNESLLDAYDYEIYTKGGVKCGI